MKQLNIRLFLKMSDDQKAMAKGELLFASFDNCVLKEGSRYWKDNSLFEFEVRFELPDERNSLLFIGVLEKLAFVSNNWNILFSSDFDNGVFSGVCDIGFKTSGISWVSFEIVAL